MLRTKPRTVVLVLAGGTGSRLAPLTNTVNKHLLPVNGQPMLHWPLRASAILTRDPDATLVTVGGKSAGEIVEQFGSAFVVRDTGEDCIHNIAYLFQPTAGGIAAAIEGAVPMLHALHAERVVVILGDNVFPVNGDTPAMCALQAKLDALPTNRALVVAREVEDPHSYGCIARNPDGTFDADIVVEKPTSPEPGDPDDGSSWVALVGLYVFPVVGLAARLELLAPSRRNELEVVDLIGAHADEGILDVHLYTGAWIDAGDPPGYRLANDPSFWGSL